MSPIDCQLRRATLDDLARLRQLWEQAKLPAATLEKSLTEFQIAEAADGTLLACIGLQLEAQQGRIHTEVWTNSEMQAEMRSRLWERVLTVAKNHGLWRLWIQDQSPFWRAQGFVEADANALMKWPARFGERTEHCLVLQLREEIAPAISFEHEFELFKQSHQDQTNRTLRQARVLRVFAAVVAALLLVFAFWMMWFLLRRLPVLSKP